MALTQTANHANPSWDETIVPALRQRLQDESRELAKRMSNMSMSSNEELQSAIHLSKSSSRSTTNTQTGTTQPSPAYPSRPVKYQRTTSQTSSRSRTLSQPPAFHPSPSTSSIPSFSSSTYTSRPDTATSGDGSRPTRIPKASKSPNLSSPPPRSPPEQPYTSAADLWEDPRHPNISSSSIIPHHTPTHKLSNGMLSQEQPPFRVGGFTSSMTATADSSSNSVSFDQQQELYQKFLLRKQQREREREEKEQYPPPRASIDSEERPFEHWYRGESSRNGGVGELRVGNRKEMLEIANYGHALRANQRAQRDHAHAHTQGYGYQDTHGENYSYSPSAYDSKKKRRRADSVGVRGSLYIDDRQANEHGPMVIDEAPLTDMESELDDEGYGDEYEDDIPSRSPTPTAGLGIRPNPHTDSTTSKAVQSTPPEQTQSSKRPNSMLMRGASEPLPRQSSSTSSSTTASPAIPPSSPSPPATVKKLRAASPSGSTNMSPSMTPQKKINSATSSPSSSYHANTPMREKQLQRERERERQRAKEKAERERKSVGKYTIEIDEEGGDMMHAIPSWTQPVTSNGNWDDVVLPAVARKKGLDADGSYEQTDGTPKPKPPSPIEPAPGTFRYDHTKYRPPRTDDESIPMDEFGQTPAREREKRSMADREEMPLPLPVPHPDSEAGSQQQQHYQTTHEKTALPERNRQNLTPYAKRSPIQSPPSPAPFSHYHGMHGDEVGAGNEGRNTEEQRVENRDEPSSGCCACVIM